MLFWLAGETNWTRLTKNHTDSNLKGREGKWVDTTYMPE